MEYIEFINKETYNTILDGINRETRNSIPQCYYVSANMGYGKTNLLHRLENTINYDLFQPIYIDSILNPIPDEEKLEEIVLRDKSNKRVVFLLDNAHYLLENWSSNELAKLRALIYNPGAPIIVFAGKRVIKAFADYSSPLYNSVLLLSLNNLTEEEQMAFIQSGCKRKQPNIQQISNIANSLEPSILIMRLILRAIKNGCRKEEDIKKEALSYFDVAFENLLVTLSPNQLLIVVALLKAESSCLLSDIVKITNLKSSDITSQIKRLEEKNLIEIIKWKPKKSLYQIKSKIFKEWYKLNVASTSALPSLRTISSPSATPMTSSTTY